MTNRSKTLMRLGLCAMICYPFAAYAQDATFNLKNSLGFDRVDELVEVALPTGVTAGQKALYDQDGNAVAYESTGYGTILFKANVPKGSIVTYTLRDGAAVSPEKLTYAAIKAPGSRDDIAWENDLAAYRMYSSTLLKSEPNTGNGVDLWQKKKAQPVIDDMYAQSNYHSENQYGVDGYSVNGRRLGAGGVSHVVDGVVVTHDPHNSCTIIENGLQRSSFEIVYDKVDVGADSYKKTVIIETSAGSMLNKGTVRYDGPQKTIKLAVALYLHTDMSGDHKTVTYTDVPGLIGLAEQNTEGTITSPGARFYLGAYMPGHEVETEILNDHLVITTDYTPGTELTYYFGGGWNVFPEDAYPTDDDWFEALNRFRKAVDSPLVVTSATSIPNREDVITVLHDVNRHWIDTHPNHESHFWDKAVYHTGNMAAYFATGEEDYREYSEAWSIHNNWNGATGTDPNRWKYTYGEGGDYVLFGDNQICFQIYLDLYNLDPQDYKIARTLEVMDYQIHTENVDYWWWVDGLYMVMPVMTKLYNITGNQLYLDKMYEYWRYATDLMWDEEEHLYYRDGGYVFPGWSILVGDDPTPKKDFWARGCGWIFAAFARVLNELPVDDPHRDVYISYYKMMAESLKAAQQPEGHWTRSILQPNYATGYETSGTALFAFGYLWGINNGIFSDADYGDVVEKAWNYLTTIALQEDKSVGYVQPIGSKAEPGVIISAGQTANFGTGAFLLAASEMMKYAAGDADVTALRLSTVRLDGSTRIVATFNEAPDQEEAVKLEHYTINGQPFTAEVETDGGRVVTFTFAEPLDFGTYVFAVTGLKSINGGELAADQQRTIIRTVPLTPSPEGIIVTAIGNQAGNTPQNTLDNNLGTRWSQAGIGQWICYNLGSIQTVKGVDIAFYGGATRNSFFDVEVSSDGEQFTSVLTGMASSGLTDELERFMFPEAVDAQYVRIVCNGNTQGGDNWNSITEIRFFIDYSASDAGEVVGLPSEIYYDILLPSATTKGLPISWMSSKPEIISETGLVHQGDAPETVTMTAYFAETSKDFDVTVMPRSLEKSLLIYYPFESYDLYAKGEEKYVRNRGKLRADALVCGNAEIDGSLNLRNNSTTTFNGNGYLIVPQGVLDSLRSYTFMLDIEPMGLEKQPRAYDFGSGSGNSIFLRLNAAAAGFKYNGGTTTLISSSTPFGIGVSQKAVVAFDASTKTTTIYINGQQTAKSTSIGYEPYQLTKVAADTRNYIGRTQWWDTNAGGDNRDFQGKIDNFRLYAMALTPEEIEMVVNEELGVKSATIDNAMLLDKKVASVGETVGINADGIVYVYNASGAQIAIMKSKGKCQFTPSTSGLYIIKSDNSVSKLLVK